jgi:hypothetical protein
VAQLRQDWRGLGGESHGHRGASPGLNSCFQVNTKVERFTCASQSHNRKLDGGPIQYIRACIADPGVLAKNVTEDELCKHLTFIKARREVSFLVLFLTRVAGGGVSDLRQVDARVGAAHQAGGRV